MQEDQPDILTESILEISTKKKKQLLPWWIKVFMWIFLVFGAFIPIGLVMGLFGYNYQLAIYGLDTNRPYSIAGISISAIFLLKGITSFGLLTEKNWAIKAGIADAILGIIICTSLMVYALITPETKFTIRLELILLVPYLLKLLKIRSDWENTIEI